MARGNGLALSIEVYTDGSDCTNGGLSALATEKGMMSWAVGGAVPLDGYREPTELLDAPGRHAVFRLERNALGNPILVADPTPAQVEMAGGRRDGLMGPMMGGNYGATSDSRFGEATGVYGALPIHDRYETHADYAAND